MLQLGSLRLGEDVPGPCLFTGPPSADRRSGERPEVTGGGRSAVDYHGGDAGRRLVPRLPITAISMPSNCPPRTVFHPPPLTARILGLRYVEPQAGRVRRFPRLRYHVRISSLVRIHGAQLVDAYPARTDRPGFSSSTSMRTSSPSTRSSTPSTTPSQGPSPTQVFSCQLPSN